MKYYFSINLSASEFLPYYQGRVEAIIATTTEGVRVQFPAMHLRQYVTSSGVNGIFCLETQNNKFSSLIKLS
jgi:hypothetical protein